MILRLLKISIVGQLLVYTLGEVSSNVMADDAFDRGTTESFVCDGNCNDEHGKPMKDLSWLSEFLNKKVHPLGWGARKIIATSFQSCSILEKTDLTEEKTQPDQTPVCGSGLSVRQSYKLGAKINYDSDKNEIDLFANGNTDCTMFVGVAMAASGLRITKNTDDIKINDDMYSRTMMAMGDKDRDCLRRAVFTRKESLRSGDVLVYQYAAKGNAPGHAMILDEVGADPFAVQHLSAPSECKASNIRFDKFDFTIFESAEGGLNRLSAVELMEKKGRSIRSLLIEMAVKACKAKTSKGKFEIGRDDSLHQDDERSMRGARILRHNGMPECINPKPPTLKGEKCINDCSQLH